MNKYQKQNARNLKKAAMRPPVDTSHKLYKNHTNKLLLLPIPSMDGSKTEIPPGETFEGTDSFLQLVNENPPMCIFVKDLTLKENIMSEQKLILDQPDTITTAGKIEHVVVKVEPVKPLNDSQANTVSKEQLLTEDPIDGIEILND